MWCIWKIITIKPTFSHMCKRLLDSNLIKWPLTISFFFYEIATNLIYSRNWTKVDQLLLPCKFYGGDISV